MWGVTHYITILCGYSQMNQPRMVDALALSLAMYGFVLREWLSRRHDVHVLHGRLGQIKAAGKLSLSMDMDMRTGHGRGHGHGHGHEHVHSYVHSYVHSHMHSHMHSPRAGMRACGHGVYKSAAWTPAILTQ